MPALLSHVVRSAASLTLFGSLAACVSSGSAPEYKTLVYTPAAALSRIGYFEHLSGDIDELLAAHSAEGWRVVAANMVYRADDELRVFVVLSRGG